MSRKGEGWYDSDFIKHGKLFKECETRFLDTGSEDDRVYMCEQKSIYMSIALSRANEREYNHEGK